MRIVLHFAGFRGGGGRVDALNLLKALPEADPSSEFLAVLPGGAGYDTIVTPPNCIRHYLRTGVVNDVRRLVFDNITLPRLSREFEADMVFTMGNMGPLNLSSVQHVVMVRQPLFAYSYTELRAAGLKPDLRLRAMRKYLRHMVRDAAAVIAQTETMRNRLADEFAIRCPMYVVPKAVTEPFQTGVVDRSRAQVDAIRNLDARFRFLFLSRYYPHKNMERLVDAVGKARRRGAEIGLILTLDREDGAAKEAIMSRITNAGLEDRIVSIGTVDQAAIQAVHREVDAVIVPSLLESFSASYIEAMRYERPLLTSDRDFAQVVCADAAVYFDPLDSAAMADAMIRMAGDDGLRRTVVEKGLRRYQAIDLSWPEIAGMYLDVFRSVKSAGARP